MYVMFLKSGVLHLSQNFEIGPSQASEIRLPIPGPPENVHGGKKSPVRTILLVFFREPPPGLINHVLTVLVFRSWVLVMPHLPSFIQEPQSVPLA